MKVKLDPDSGHLTKDKKRLDQRKALITTGVKAAVCFKDGEITPEEIRATETEEQLIKRGINTILSDHTSPSEQVNISLEIENIPKMLCMVLNNEHQYEADERSLRYTPVKESDYISSAEVNLYNKWLNIFINILNQEYYDFFLKFNQGKNEEHTQKKVAIAIKKIAQENARYMVGVFVPTTLTYTVPWAQINKICKYMDRIITNPLNEFEELLIPYFTDFRNQLLDLNVLITEHQAKKLCPSLNIKDTDNLLYKNNKYLDLSLFAERNQFSGIKLPNEYGVAISYNMQISWASLAQFHRHRTMYFEMLTPNKESNKFYVPLLLSNKKKLTKEWLMDMALVSKYYPQGQLLEVNVTGPLKNLINYVGKERACERAFLETEDMFVNKMLPDIYHNLFKENKDELALVLAPYINRQRCMYPDYNCPTPCGHARVRERKF